MKHLKSFAAIALLALALPALAQVTPLNTGTFTITNVLAGVSDNTLFIHATNGNVVEIHGGKGLGLVVESSAAAVTNVATHRFQVSHDGTIWQHATPHILQFNLTSVSTNYIFGTNLPADVLDNWRFLRFYSTTLANTNAVTNRVYWTRRN